MLSVPYTHFVALGFLGCFSCIKHIKKIHSVLVVLDNIEVSITVKFIIFENIPLL